MLEFCYGVACVLGAVAAVMIGFGILCCGLAAGVIALGAATNGTDYHTPRFTVTTHHVVHLEDGTDYEIEN